MQPGFAAHLGVLAVAGALRPRRASAPFAGAPPSPGRRAAPARPLRAPARASGAAHHLAGLVEQQRAGGRAADLVDAHHPLLAHVRRGAGDRDDVAVDFGHRVVDVVHVRLDDLHEHLVALAERQRALLDLLAGALEGDREVVEREPFGALEQERLAGLGLERVQHARAVAGELGASRAG